MKTCPICEKPVTANDLVVVLLMARYKPIEDTKYELEAMAQTIVSHLFCVQKQPVNLEAAQ